MTTWNIEASHMVAVPAHIIADTAAELRGWVRRLAESKKVRSDRPAIGELSYRYELDSFDEVQVVHVYFTNRHGKRTRFMRLRREQDSCTSVADVA